MLKESVQKETKVVSGMKLMLRGSVLKDDEKTLAAVGIKSAAKLLLVGSTASEIADISQMKSAPGPTPAATTETTPKKKPTTLGEGVQDLPVHRRIIEDGPPEDVMAGFSGYNDLLPRTPISGLLNSRREHTRLTFDIFKQEMVINTKSQTERVLFASVKNVMWEPIKGNERYAIMAFQLGRNDCESARYYVYWVPAQYAQAIRNTVM